MKAIDIEKLNQLISRTDISGNDKVRWLTNFIDGRELQLIQDEFYSEEEVIKLWNWLNDGFIIRKSLPTREELIKWLKQFKKK